MLSSRKTLEPRNLHGSATYVILSSQSKAGHRPPSFLFSFHREFSWGLKHKNSTSRAGKVYKGFSTRDYAGKDMTPKQLYRSTIWGNNHLRRYLPRYAPIQEWRFSSSWGKKPETSSSSSNKVEPDEEEDWYTRWEKQKLRQYDDFMKRVEHDPYTALFGKSWLNFSDEVTEPKPARTTSPGAPRETSVPRNGRPPENGPSKSKPSRTSENKDSSGTQSKCGTMPTQEHDQEYEIDPITNRKVLKTSASGVSTVRHIKPQVVEEAFDVFSQRWDLVSPTPMDSRFIMVEHAQTLSNSHLPSKDTPATGNGDGWLAQEGFGDVQEPQAKAQTTLQSHNAKANTKATKIESALDRHLSRKRTNEREKNDRPQLQYKPEENKTEDVDLLRPSDVRASAGLRGNSPKETDIDKQARRQKLERNYERCSLDRASQSARGTASDELVEKRDDRPVETSKEPELRFGSWLKGTLEDAKLKDKEASKGTSTVRVNRLSDATNFESVSVDQKPDSTPAFKTEFVSEPSNVMAPDVQAEARDKANKLKAQIVPFKARLDAMKADYDSLRLQWLQEIRRMKEKAAKKEEEVKAQKLAKRVREVHEEEIETQKVAMEAMEMRSSHGGTNTANTALAKSIGDDDGQKPAPRRLQSFLQGEGDMASNVHEFAGRDRWYKRKAPHAMDAKDVEMDAKVRKFAADRALIREIRGIYEDTYGTIDTEHRQTFVRSLPLEKNSSQSITSPSKMVGLHAQLPSSDPSRIESSRGLEEPQSSDALEIVQRLFGQLREAQSVIQDYRRQTKQASGPSDQIVNLISAFEKSVMHIVRTSGQLARVRLDETIHKGSVEAIAAANSKKPTTNRPLSTTEPKPTDLEVREATKLNTYCVLAYDSATQEVQSAEGTTLAPFSKEESLLPLDALNRLRNPGKFLPHVMSLGNKGYVPVSGSSNVLVFKKEVTLQGSAEIKKADARKEPNPIRSLPDHLRAIAGGSIRERCSDGLLTGITKEDIQEYRQTPLQGIEREQQEVTEAQKQTAEKMDKAHEKVEKARQTAMDGIENKKQPFEEAQKQQSASSASRSHTPGNKVHRQETVFSGSRQGRWVDNSVKAKKNKRAAGRRRKTKHMLMAGVFTAACCYCVGVASEMMHD